MSLVLEIEHLSGVCFAALGPDSDAPDWPIQPDRAFSALVAAWAARGSDPDERSALAWLENQTPPRIEASEVAPRTSPTVFVPPNDTRTRLGRDLGAMLGAHGRQARRFPAVGALSRDCGLLTRFVWPDAELAQVPLEALDAVARDTAYVGHSSSLTRCRFFMRDAREGGQQARRRVYPGRLDELERDFARGRRPSPGEAVRAAADGREAPMSIFSPEWLVLEIVRPSGERLDSKPDLRVAPLLAKRLRDAVMSGYGQANLDVPALISGHQPDGAPSVAAHLAIISLANVGFAYSDASVHGFGLVAPRGVRLLDDFDFRRALAAIALYDESSRSRRLTLYGDGAEFLLRFGGEPTGLSSLDPGRYVGPAATWATATPMVLERHLKEKSPVGRLFETEALVVRACENIGLPRPAVVTREGWADRPAVLTDKHSAILAAPSAAPSGKNPRWMRWRTPERFATRPLVHAVVRFPEPVQGPVILGAGRFVGLGLCLPLDCETQG